MLSVALRHLGLLAVIAVALRGRHGTVLAVTLGHLGLLAVHAVAWNRHLDEAASPRRATMAVGPVHRVVATLARRHDHNRRDDWGLLLGRRLASLGRAVALAVRAVDNVRGAFGMLFPGRRLHGRLRIAVRAVNDIRRTLHHSCRWEHRHRNVGGSEMLPGVAIDNAWRASGDDSWGGVNLGHGTSGHDANDKHRANHIE